MTESTSEYVIPDFGKDAAALTAYEEAKTRLERHEVTEAETRVQLAFARRRDVIKEEIAAAAGVVTERRKIADQTRDAYLKRFPKRQDRDKPLEPSFWENFWSFGLARKMYRAVIDATIAANTAEMARRQKETEEQALGSQMQAQMLVQAEMFQRKRSSPTWIDEINSRPPLAQYWQRVIEVQAERANYAERLAAGKVSALEQRDRAFVEQQIRQLELPFAGMLITAFQAYGARSYWIFRSLEGRLFALSYDPRLAPLTESVLDVYRLGTKYEVKLTRADAKPMTAVEHYNRCEGGEGAGRVAYDQARVALRAVERPREAAPVTNATEGELIELLAQFAAEQR